MCSSVSCSPYKTLRTVGRKLPEQLTEVISIIYFAPVIGAFMSMCATVKIYSCMMIHPPFRLFIFNPMCILRHDRNFSYATN